MNTDSRRDRMTDEEFTTFWALLRRYSAIELDQWAMWQTDTPHGPVFITIDRQPWPGSSPDNYNPLPSGDIGAR